jgi:putative ABC transport system permease protein
MFDIDKWQEIFHVLKSNKLRTFMTAFGVFWGIFMLVIMLGAGRGLQNGVFRMWGDFATKSFNGIQRGKDIEFNNDDIKAIRTNIEGIRYLAPRKEIWSGGSNNINVTRNIKNGSFDVQGETPESNLINPAKLSNGRYLNEIDMKNNRKVAVIGTRVNEVLFLKNENPIGQYICINGMYFQVIGTMAQGKDNNWEARETIKVPITTLQQLYNLHNKIGYFSVTAYDGINVEAVENQILGFLRKRHNIDPTDEQAIGHFNVANEINKIFGLFLGIRILIWIVGIGTLLSGIIGVSNIMLIVVKERTKEFGIRRAIGAKPFSIINQIVTESIFLTSFAGLFGMSLGVMVIESVSKAVANLPPETPFRQPGVDFSIGIISLALLIFCGIIAGLIPAFKAIEVKPVEALRDE